MAVGFKKTGIIPYWKTRQTGTFVKSSGLNYMFLGFVSETRVMLADQHGNKHIQFKSNINF